MTLTQLADLAGVSVSTVSKVFSGSSEISEGTKERVLRLAKENNCFDKYYKGPRTRPLIALLLPEPESDLYSRVISVLERAISLRGGDTVIAFTRFDHELEARLFRDLVWGMRVSGVILWGSGNLISNPDEVPLVAICNDAPPQNADMVSIDMFGGICKMLEHVKEYGHTEIGFLGEELTRGKEKQFREAMRRVGMPVREKYIFCSEKRFSAAGEEGMRALIEHGSVPDVIFAAYDKIALGAMSCAREHGYRLPEDISFIGMDDAATDSLIDPPLSSVSVDIEQVCREIVELVFRRIDNRFYRSRTHITIPATASVRGSLRKI